MAFTGPAEDRLAIRELLDIYADAVTRCDANDWGATWAEDAQWSMPDYPEFGTTKGKAAIVAMWVEAMKIYPGLMFEAWPGSIEINGNEAAYFNVRGRCLLAQDRNEEAAANFESALKLDPSVASYFLNAGLAYNAAEKFERAAEVLTTCISLDPAKARAYHERATAYEGLGKTELAEADESKAEELEEGK